MPASRPVLRRLAAALLCAWAVPASAQGADDATGTVVISGQRGAPRSGGWDLPASYDVVGRDAIRLGQPQVNLSESLVRVPGLVAQNRQNYAQDLQISVRGFGARSTFGVRGLRIFVDGIPATLPDGQGQVSHVELGSAGRVEVLRGPFSALYGNSSGGVIAVFSETPPPGHQLAAEVAGGSDGLRRIALKASGRYQNADNSALDYLVSSAHFSTDGFRPQSAATRDTQNARLRLTQADGTRIAFTANALQSPDVQDPLGLSRTQFDANPYQTDPNAITYNTRKSVKQSQFGLSVDKPLGGGDRISVSAYAGDRATVQFQSIPAPTVPPFIPAQNAPTHSGGVIDLQRSYYGIDLRYAHDGLWQQRPLRWTAGLAIDQVDEERRGYQNFVGTTIGVQGALRRNERNRATSIDPYVQAEWEPSERWLLLAGLRASRVSVSSSDQYIVAGNGDDSGSMSFRALSPVLGVTFRASPAWQAYASYGRGFETPTLAELAYRPNGALGFNTALRAARSNHLEAGLKARPSAHTEARLAVFHVETRDELAVFSNTGGRSVFRNVPGTKRRGVEATAEGRWPGGFGALLSLATLDATFTDAFAGSSGAVAAGNRIPGAPSRTAYGELSWRHAPTGFFSAFEVRHVGRVYVNDTNSDAAAAYTVTALRLGVERALGPWQLGGFVRVDNLADRRYAGSVIVNEGNARFFEPAPGRSTIAGVSAALRW